MPQLANAKKALRQSAKRAERNKVIRNEIYSMRRRFRKLLEGDKFDEARKMISEFDKKLDKAVTKNIFQKNKSARLKAQVAAMLKRFEAKKSK